MCAITFGNRSISGHILLVCAIAMSGRTRDCEESSSRTGPLTKKRAVLRKTVEKWVVENDRVLNTSVWLKFEGDHNQVFSHRFAVC